MKINEFLMNFFGSMGIQEIKYCVLRNHESLPEWNDGKDIDILVEAEKVDSILGILRSIEGIRVTGVLRRAYVWSIFIYGVSWGERTAIEIDLVTKLSWKGLTYLEERCLLASAYTPEGKPDYIKIPQPYDEAIVSLMANYLLCGAIKERYFDKINQYVKKYKKETMERLSISFGSLCAQDICEAIISRDMARLNDNLINVKKGILVNKLYKKPVEGIKSIVLHYVREMQILVSRRSMFVLVVLGPDGAGKTTVLNSIQSVTSQLYSEIRVKHLKPTLFMKKRIEDRGVVTDPHATPARGWFMSNVKIMAWLIESWVASVFIRNKNLSLHIFDRYYYDIFVDPVRYRFNGSKKLMILIGKIIPKADLILVITAPANIIQSRKQEVSMDETLRQVEEYKKIKNKMCNVELVDSNNDILVVKERVINLIVKYASNYGAQNE